MILLGICRTRGNYTIFCESSISNHNLSVEMKKNCIHSFLLDGHFFFLGHLQKAMYMKEQCLYRGKPRGRLLMINNIINLGK